MSRSRRRAYEEPEDEIRLDEALEPYEEQPWQEEAYPEYETDDVYAEEYSDEHEETDHEGRFRIAMGLFDMLSILAGMAVILLLVAMLLMLLGWLKTDVLHSALMLQSGLQ